VGYHNKIQLYCKFTAESNSEKKLKIGKHLSEAEVVMWQKAGYLRCISQGTVVIFFSGLMNKMKTFRISGV